MGKTSMIRSGWIVLVLLVSWSGPVLADDTSDVKRAVEAFLGPKCGKHPISLSPSTDPMVPGTWSCSCPASERECPSISVNAITGSFTAPKQREAFLAVQAPEEVSRSEGFGYTVLMRLVEDGAAQPPKGVWKVVARGASMDSVKKLSAILANDGRAVIFECSWGCWQSCCTGGCGAAYLTVRNGQLEQLEAGTYLPIGDTGGLDESYRTASAEAVMLKDVNGDGQQDLVVVVRVEEGKQDESGDRHPSSQKDVEMKFLFDGKSYKLAPGSPSLRGFACE